MKQDALIEHGYEKKEKEGIHWGAIGFNNRGINDKERIKETIMYSLLFCRRGKNINLVVQSHNISVHGKGYAKRFVTSDHLAKLFHSQTSFAYGASEHICSSAHFCHSQITLLTTWVPPAKSMHGQWPFCKLAT